MFVVLMNRSASHSPYHFSSLLASHELPLHVFLQPNYTVTIVVDAAEIHAWMIDYNLTKNHLQLKGIKLLGGRGGETGLTFKATKVVKNTK